MKIPTGDYTPEALASYLYLQAQTMWMALSRIADPECERIHGSRDRVASDALHKVEANYIDTERAWTRS